MATAAINKFETVFEGVQAPSALDIAKQLYITFRGYTEQQVEAGVVDNLNARLDWWVNRIEDQGFNAAQAAEDFIVRSTQQNETGARAPAGQIPSNIENGVLLQNATEDNIDELLSTIQEERSSSAGEIEFGGTFSLTAGADRGEAFTGTNENNKFEAFLTQNEAAGGISNTLSSADSLNGGGGRNTLEAQLIPEFSGNNTGGSTQIRPVTQNIQEVYLEVVQEPVTLNAARMRDVEQFWSDYSDGSLTINNVNLNGGNLSITRDVTFGLRDVAAGTNFTANFQSDALTREGPGRSDSALRLNLMDMGTEESPYDANAPLGQLPVNGFAFSIDGVRKEVRSEDILEARTYAELLVAVQTAIAEAAATDESLQGLSVERVQNGFTTAPQVVLLPNGGTRTQQGDSIVINDAQGRDLEGLSYIQEGDTTGFTLFGRFGADDARETTNLIESNLILDYAGRGSVAGNVDLNSNSGSPIGVEKVNLMVDRDSAINRLSSQDASNDRYLQEIEVTSLENNGSLRINNLNDVQVFNATAFEGASLTLGNVVINSAEGHTYTSAGSTVDVMNFRVDQEAAASSNFSLDIVTGGGNDVVNVSFTGQNTATPAAGQIDQQYGVGSFNGSNGNGTNSQWANLLQMEATNTNISALSGDNTITTYGFGVSNIRTGSGDDAIKTDNSGAKASFVVNGAQSAGSVVQQIGDTNINTSIVGNGNNSFNIFKTKVQVDFMGVTSDYVLIDSTDFRTSSRQINEAIKEAIENDAHLSKILAVEDVRDEGLVVRSLIDRSVTAADLNFNFLAPRKADGTNAVNATFDQFRAQETVTDQELQNAWETYFNSTWGGTSNAISTENAMLAQINTNVTGLGTGDYNVTAADIITAGGNSTALTHNTVNAGGGNDTIVLSSNINGGFDTVVFEDNFGHNVILNFNTGNGGGIADQLDFTSYLDAAADARGSSANTGTNAYTDGAHDFRLIPQGTASWANNAFGNTNAVDTANAVGAHNSVNFVTLTQIWNNIPAAQRPESFFDLTDAELKAAVDDLYSNQTVDTRANGMDSVLVVVQDQLISNNAGVPTLAGGAGSTNAIVFSLNMNVQGTNAGNATFTVDRRGSFELENAFSDLSNVTAASIAGTTAAKGALANLKEAESNAAVADHVVNTSVTAGSLGFTVTTDDTVLVTSDGTITGTVGQFHTAVSDITGASVVGTGNIVFTGVQHNTANLGDALGVLADSLNIKVQLASGAGDFTAVDLGKVDVIDLGQASVTATLTAAQLAKVENAAAADTLTVNTLTGTVEATAAMETFVFFGPDHSATATITGFTGGASADRISLEDAASVVASAGTVGNNAIALISDLNDAIDSTDADAVQDFLTTNATWVTSEDVNHIHYVAVANDADDTYTLYSVAGTANTTFGELTLVGTVEATEALVAGNFATV